MSNLHKDLTNDQIHNPKDFVSATNDTYLSKNASGNLEWRAVSSGGGGLVTSLTTSGSTGAATLSGAGVLNIPQYDNNDQLQTTTSWRGCAIVPAGEGRVNNGFILSSPCNTERTNPFLHSVALGGLSASMIVTAANLIGGSVSTCTSTNSQNLVWNGSIYGTGNGSLCLYRANVCGILGEGNTTTMQIISETSFELNAEIPVKCFAINSAFAQTVSAGDLIIPVVSLTAAGGSLSYVSTLRVKAY